MYTLGCVTIGVDDCLPPVWELEDEFTSASGAGGDSDDVRDDVGSDAGANIGGEDGNTSASVRDDSVDACGVGANGNGATVGMATCTSRARSRSVMGGRTVAAMVSTSRCVLPRMRSSH